MPHIYIIFLATIMLIMYGEEKQIWNSLKYLPPPSTPTSLSHHSPHNLALKNPQSLFFSSHKTPKFTPTPYDRNNFSFRDEYMQHSALNGSKHCLNLFCSFSQEHGQSQIVSRCNISWTRLTTKWWRYCTRYVTLNTNCSTLHHKDCSTLHHKDCSKSILHSPIDSLIRITREDRNTKYLLKVNTQQKDINLTRVPDSWRIKNQLDVTCYIYFTS